MPPPVTDVNRPFWTSGPDGPLQVQFCEACDRWVFPAAATCPACSGMPVWRRVSGAGTVFTFTVNRHPYHPDVPVPYVIAIVDLVEQEGLRFTTNVVACDPEVVAIGMPVQVAFEAAGDEAWAPVFRPA
jgi:uncharacterized OB-fold protein